ncbi:uncharacterized protein C8Q71DRAFT_817771 [Rhodofomes roseus]|uniref:F-box domain-containing protein n=1 Tax=Rhodofomes roseus TaxID=34475 RepID=A0ABQ8K0X4_9APHY|nr:uncharacterized protein C8Q71DRAFT_817771 [Rhodofomes roseus]KAH9830076.1 hypothetical protein C8Q71DRAFT_817771 [Rhodofomes roseus]
MQISHVSAAQRLLGVPEILTQVAEEVEDKYTAASLARTCRDFCSPALDVLWRSQLGLVNIIKCMPADLWEIQGSFTNHTRLTLTIRRAMRPGDWDRFNVYAPRIRELCLHFDGFWTTLYTDDVWSALDMYAPSRPLFPNLRKWEYYDIPQRNAPNQQLFISATLLELTLRWRSFDEPVALLLACLPQCCPRLRTLLIRIESGYVKPPQWPPRGIFDSLKELRTVTMAGDLDSDLLENVLVELRSLPHLKALTIENISENIWMSAIPPVQVPPSFGALTALHLSCNEGHSCAQMLETSYFPALEELDIYVIILGPLKDIFRIVQNHCSPTTLRILRVIGSDEGDSEFVGPDVGLLADADDFCPLYGFHNLEEVWVQSLHDISLMDDDLHDMALAWPNLRTLWLIPPEWLLLLSFTPDTFSPAGTLMGLLPFAQHCPQLTSLALALDTSHTDADRLLDASPSILQCESAVTHLLIGECEGQTGDVQQIAMSLALMFPQLEVVVGDYPRLDTDPESVWMEVDRIYPQCLREVLAKKRQHRKAMSAAAGG